jgi:hypothetical protein
VKAGEAMEAGQDFNAAKSTVNPQLQKARRFFNTDGW